MNTWSLFLAKYLTKCLSFAVPHVSGSLAKMHHFGRVGGADHRLTFALRRTIPVTADRSPVRREMIAHVNERTSRVLMTDAVFATDTHIKLEKPAFFFGDHVSDGGKPMYDGNYRWLRQTGIPAATRPQERHCP